MNAPRPLMLCALALACGVPTFSHAALKPISGAQMRFLLPSQEKPGPDPGSLASRLRASLTECVLSDLLVGSPTVDDTGLHLQLHLAPGLSFPSGHPLRAKELVQSFLDGTSAPRAPDRFRLLVLKGAAARLAGRDSELALRVLGPLRVELTLALPLGLEALSLLSSTTLPIRHGPGEGCGPFHKDPDSGTAVRRQGSSFLPFKEHPLGRPLPARVQLLRPRGATPGLQNRALATPGQGELLSLRKSVATPKALPIGSETLTLLVVNGSPQLKQSLSQAINRRELVRYLVGGDAKARSGLLSRPIERARLDATSVSPHVPTAGPLELSYDSAKPLHRRIAERLQVRLHALGVDLRLHPTDPGSLRSGATALALLNVVGLPLEAGPRLADLTTLLIGPSEGLALWRQVLETQKQGDTLDALAAELLTQLPAIPLFSRPETLYVSPTLQGIAPHAELPLDPGALWVFPRRDPGPRGP